jgi:hypothetical protein
MSGAAGIAAAKNRRSKQDEKKKQLPPPISCSSKNNSCPVPNKSSAAAAPSQTNKTLLPQLPTDLVNPNTLQILGPMPPAQILKLHEQRLNKMDERFNQSQPEETDGEFFDDVFERITTLESKIGMLEEVVMNLQNKLTIAQNFAMETNMSVMNLIKAQNAQPAVIVAEQTSVLAEQTLIAEQTSEEE